MLSLHPLIRLHSKDDYLNMAARFVVTLALVGLCASAPGVYRQERAYSIGQAYNAAGGSSAAQANANSNSAQAYGSTNGGQLARNGFYYPGQAIAQAQTFEPGQISFGGAKAIAQAQNGAELLPLPVPASVITYQQNFELPTYQPGAVVAQSSALNNGASEATNSFATSNGDGVAESSANTQGLGFGQTTSNAKTYGGVGFADSNAKTGYGSTSTSARTQGQGSATSNAAINEPLYAAVPVATPVEVVPVVPAIIEAKSPLYHTAYVPSGHIVPVASSNANVVGAGHAASSARINGGGLTHGRTISWRFGTQYDSPASAHAQANSNGFGSAKSTANTNLGGYGNAQSSADSNGSGSARADANTNYGFGNARTGADYNGAYYGGSRTSADAQTNGFGNAASSARTQGLSTAYRVANSQANSSGYGSAHANAQSA